MGFHIEFIKRPSAGDGLHLIAQDGCKVCLTESNSLTREQLKGIDAIDEPYRRKYLLFLNKQITDIEIEKGFIEIRCPKCKRDYIITQEEYESAYKRFANPCL